MSKSAAAEVLIKEFCRAWERRDPDAIIAMMDEEIVYWNVPAPAIRGRDAVRGFIVPLLRDTVAIEFRLRAVVANAAGDKVLTERLDRLVFPSGVLEIPLMGIFELHGGRIAAWREYADFASIDAATAALGVTLAPAPC